MWMHGYRSSFRWPSLSPTTSKSCAGERCTAVGSLAAPDSMSLKYGHVPAEMRSSVHRQRQLRRLRARHTPCTGQPKRQVQSAHCMSLSCDPAEKNSPSAASK